MSRPNGARGSGGCPTADELFAFAVGRLSGDACDTIASHIEGCAACLAALQELNDQADPLLAELRQPLPAELFTPHDGGPLPGHGASAAGGPSTCWRGPGREAGEPGSDEAGLPAIPGYEIIRELGRAGMGVVYSAWQAGLKRTVALKMILAGDYASPQELARFHTEAEAVARLQHPHIVQVYEVGRADRCPYLALEYVDGGSLAQRLTGTPWPARQAAQLAETLARAVHYAHQRGVVHRDLTPGNILLVSGGGVADAGADPPLPPQPKITDFGLAKLLVGGGPPLTQSGAVVGTPSYMAPEQAGGKPHQVGPAVDVYALGAILYELVTGRPPFKAATPLDTVLQVISDEPVPPRRRNPRVPADLEAITLKCLKKDQRKRYATAESLADDLRRWLDGEPTSARPSGFIKRAVRWVRQQPIYALGLACFLSLVFTVLMYSVPPAVKALLMAYVPPAVPVVFWCALSAGLAGGSRLALFAWLGVVLALSAWLINSYLNTNPKWPWPSLFQVPIPLLLLTTWMSAFVGLVAHWAVSSYGGSVLRVLACAVTGSLFGFAVGAITSIPLILLLFEANRDSRTHGPIVMYGWLVACFIVGIVGTVSGAVKGSARWNKSGRGR
jgi:hypothetical protein